MEEDELYNDPTLDRGEATTEEVVVEWPSLWARVGGVEGEAELYPDSSA